MTHETIDTESIGEAVSATESKKYLVIGVSDKGAAARLRYTVQAHSMKARYGHAPPCHR